jgi:sugar phosphate isomerase/epimerase
MSLSRRALFGTGAGAVSLALRPRGAQAAPPGSKTGRHELKLGLVSYSLRKFSLDRVIEFCKASGIVNVTLKDIHLPETATPDAIATATGKLKDAGITLMGCGVIYFKKDDKDPRRHFEYAKACGAPLIVASPDPETLDTVEGLVKEFGIPLAIHNHGPEDKHYPSPRDVMAVIKKRDKRLGVCMDIGHTVRAGVDPAKAALECGDRLLDLHLKDLKDKTSKESQVEIGRGSLDIVALLKALEKIRFKGQAGIEYEINAEDPFPGIRESMAYLRGALAGLSA